MSGEIVLGTYLVLLLVVGALTHRGKMRQAGHTTNVLFLAAKSLPWWLLSVSLVAGFIGATSFLGVAGLTARYGPWAIAYLAAPGLALVLFGLLLAPALASRQVPTVGALLARTYGDKYRRPAGGILAVIYCLVAAAQIRATQIVITALLGYESKTALLVTVAALAIYSVGGGLSAVVVTDLLQLGMVAAVLLVGFYSVGSDATFAALAFDAPDSYATMPLPTFLGICSTFFVVLVAQETYERVAATKSPAAARKVCVWAGVALLVFAILVPGLAHSVKLNAGAFTNEAGFISAVQSLLPAGLFAVFAIGLLSAALSTLDSVALASAHMLAVDVLGMRNEVKRWLPPVAIVTFVGGALVIAPHTRTIIDLVLTAVYAYVAAFVVPVAGALLWRDRAKRCGMTISAGVLVVVFWWRLGPQAVPAVLVAVPTALLVYIAENAFGGRKVKNDKVR